MKTKVLLIGCNPSVKSPDNTPFHASTRSRIIIDRWFQGIDADISFMNLTDEKRSGNRAFTRKELISLEDPVFLRLKSFQNHRIITLGKAPETVIKALGIDFFAMPHPSGLNRLLNDPAYIEEKIKKLRGYLSFKT